MKQMTFFISRFDPECDESPRIEKYTVEVNDGARVLNILEAVRLQDPTLSFRSSCRAGQCGSCAVRVNGEPALACMKEATDGMRIEPLELPVIKDLMVELVPGINNIPRIHPSSAHEVPSQDIIGAIKPFRDCIECLSCVSVCPAMQVTDFIGPTSMRAQMRIALDPREPGTRIREAISQGLFNCTSCNRCTVVCPKHIEIEGKAIEKLREIANREGLTLPRHQEVAELVRTTGRSVETSGKTFLDQIPEIIEPVVPVIGEVGFFVGCMFNGRLPERAMDLIEVMKRVGIRVIIPKDQVCCGSPLIRTGQTSFLDELQDWSTVGIDCIAMNVNDLYVMNLEPVAFVDYIATDALNLEQMKQIGIGLNEGARQANISVIGGETATLKGLVSGLDLAGACLGVQEKDRVIRGDLVAPGDVIVGIPSSGIHSNGLTLARRMVAQHGSYDDRLSDGRTIGETLLTPTRIYAEVLQLTRNTQVHGMCHITGGGLLNLTRLSDYGFSIDSPLPPQDVYRWIQESGDISDPEMYRTFNMGMGYVCIVPQEGVGVVLEVFPDAKVVGAVTKEPGVYLRGEEIR
jgi:phosphoribosylaminoimidazole synthetase